MGGSAYPVFVALRGGASAHVDASAPPVQSGRTPRRWALEFRQRSLATSVRFVPGLLRWHLDEVAVLIGGERLWLWLAVDADGEVLDPLVQPTGQGRCVTATEQGPPRQGCRNQ
jgi:hypothetical protein